MKLTVDITQKALGAYVVRPAGSLDTQTQSDFDRAVAPILDADIRLLAFDMQKLQYISSAGISSIIKARKAVKKNDGKVVFMNLQPQIRRVFEIIQAIPSMHIFESVKELDDYLDTIQKKVLAGNS